MTAPRPLVSVIVPFYNTAEFLPACIESILAQTYDRFELILVNNQSTDGSDLIAQSYARQDTRIRLLHNPEFVGQVANTNGAVRHAASEAAYLKIVQADDALMPECLERMVAAGEAHPSALIITSYYLKGRDVLGSGVPWPQTVLSGRDALRLHLLEGRFLFGSPSTIMFRSTVLRARDPFYQEGLLHEDSEAVYQILEQGDVAFVHQVLSFLRVREGSLLSGMATYSWQLLDFYIIVKKYGRRQLSPEEYAACLERITVAYRGALGEARLFRREPGYWSHQRKGLATCGERVPEWWRLVPYMARTFLSVIRHPRWALQEYRRAREARIREAAG